MARSIVDCKDISTQALVYPRTHADAVILSDGRNVTTAIEQLEASVGNVAYPIVNHGTTDTTFTLTPNVMHVWGEVGSLTITLGAETAGVVNEYAFQFTSGATATTFTYPSSLKWVNGEVPSIEVDSIYEVRIINNCAVCTAFR